MWWMKEGVTPCWEEERRDKIRLGFIFKQSSSIKSNFVFCNFYKY